MKNKIPGVRAPRAKGSSNNEMHPIIDKPFVCTYDSNILVGEAGGE